MAQTSTCPALQDLAAFLLGRLPASEAVIVAQHLATCDSCRATVQCLSGTSRPVGREVPADAPTPRERLLREAPRERGEDGTHKAPPLPTPIDVELPAALAPTRAVSATEYPFLAPPQAPGEIGRLGSYRVLKLLGSGGMGMVFQAEDSQLRRTVALKVMKPECSAHPVSRERFLREARAVAALQHDHVVTVYQVGEQDGTPFLAMQFLKGESLDDRLQREEKLPIDEVLRIGREIAEGLAAAHAQGLIHRDIKPGNIWLEGDSGRVKILDFGLARGQDDTHLTRTGTVLGTPQYMSPEQARGKAVDHRCDLFSLGCVLYDMCAGQPPFHAQETMAVLLAVTTQTPRALTELNPKVPQPLVITIVRLLAKHVDDRPQTAAEVVKMLRAIEEGRAVAQPMQPMRLARRRQTSRSSLVWTMLAAFLIGAIGVASFWYGPEITRFIEQCVEQLQKKHNGR
jgi:predicted Ser/Thr protein kinase